MKLNKPTNMYKLFSICFLFCSMTAFGQSITDSIANPGFSMDDSIGERLSELITPEHAAIKVLDKDIEGQLYDWKRSKLNWLPSVTPSFNLNERNINKPDSGNIYYPRWNISLSIPLSNFFAGPKAAKTAKARYESSIASKELQVRNIKESVKAAYKAYQTNKYLLSIQETIIQDEYVLFSQTEGKFEKNEVRLEDFTSAAKRYSAELATKVKILNEVNLAKMHLENLLGVDFDTAMKMINTPK